MCCFLHIIDNVLGNVLLGVLHLLVIVLFHIYCFIEQWGVGDIHMERRLVGEIPNSTQIGPDTVRWWWSYISPPEEGWTIHLNPYFNHFHIAILESRVSL